VSILLRRGMFKTTALLAFFVSFLSLFCFTPARGLGTTSQGYKTADSDLVAGMAVSLVTDSTDNQQSMVEGSSIVNASKFIGIITTIDDNVISVRDKTSEVLVTREGKVTAFVSDLTGEVKKGDTLQISPLKGILTKLDTADIHQQVAGIALEDFPSTGTTSQTITRSDNTEQTVEVAKLQIEVDKTIANNTTQAAKSFLRLTGESLTGKAVSQAQVIAALVVFLIILMLEGSIIYGAIHSSISALGRNPLSKKAVFKQLLQVSWLALLVLVFGFGGIYLILWV
jgi:hypothetical protein